LPLTALVIVDERAPDLTILGLSAIEFQMRQAVAAGAAHVVIFVQRLPVAVHAAADRLRRERISVDIARSIADAVDFVHPDDRILLISLPLFVAPPVLAQLAAASQPSLLCIDRDSDQPQLEAIDTLSRWTGHALFDGAILRAIAATVGDWDFASVLLRTMVQRGCAQMRVAPPDQIMRLTTGAQAQALGRALLTRADDAVTGIGTAVVTAPAARMLARWGAEYGLNALWIEAGALALVVVCIVCAIPGMIAASMLGLVLALIVSHAAAALRRATGARGRRWPLVDQLADLGCGAVILLAGITLTRLGGQWGCILVAIMLLWIMTLLTLDPPQAGSTRRQPDRDLLMMIMALAAVVGAPLTGLFVAMILAAGTLTWRRQRAGRAKCQP
jgi:hypothetical protein